MLIHSHTTYFSKAALPNRSQYLKMVEGDCKKQQTFKCKMAEQQLDEVISNSSQEKKT